MTTDQTATGASTGTARRDPLAYLADEIEELRRQALYRPLRIMSGPQVPHTTMDGRPVISLSSNNYLGLATHPRLVEAALDAVRDLGAGSGAVRTIAGTMELHQELERRLAAFKHTEAVLTFQSGFTANSGVIPTITGEHDLIVSDELNHASIIDGVRLSKASRAVFPHRDVDGLERVLREARDAGGPKGAYRHILVITDGVFSMDGDIAPLADICAVAERYEAAVMVDDAHASGVLGRNGRGTVDHFDLHGRVDVQVGTLSKAVGVLGGYVAGRQHLRDHLIQRSRPFLFSTSHPPAVAAACMAAIDVLEQEPERIERLWERTRFFKAGLERLGFDTGVSETPITPVIVGSSEAAGRMSDRLFQLGVFAQAVVYPTVALDRARIRTIVTSEHSQDDLRACLEAFETAGRELRII
ncbi:MAG TPA: glycine C-acetyltransferase [Candidatus Limnocylindrales bacterium]|nr:glycine C-acetyltransferase [Candidatus Limnocylindrales bacterium]